MKRVKASANLSGHSEIRNPGAEQRSDERVMTILRVGKLVANQSQQLCLIRNISSGGLMAHVYAPHAVGDKIEIELKSDQQLRGEIAWVKDDHIGVRFEGEILVSDILTNSPAPDGRMPRAPRLDIDDEVRIKIGADEHGGSICDLSQGGIKVEIHKYISVGEEADIIVDGLPLKKGIVRWCRKGRAGLEFARPIPFDTLIAWLERRNTGTQKPH
ncbi:MAG: PilZ domain-containing protein [Chakrabartia sp.]